MRADQRGGEPWLHAQRHGGACFGCGQPIHLRGCEYVALMDFIDKALA